MIINDVWMEMSIDVPWNISRIIYKHCYCIVIQYDKNAFGNQQLKSVDIISDIRVFSLSYTVYMIGIVWNSSNANEMCYFLNCNLICTCIICTYSGFWILSPLINKKRFKS